MTKYVIAGLGSVGRAFMRIAKQDGLFDDGELWGIDFTDGGRDAWLALGGAPERFIQQAITCDGFPQLLGFLEAGDFLFDFCAETANVDIYEFCLARDVHYLCTCDDSWPGNDSITSMHAHYARYQELREPAAGHASSVIQIGMNPGMVSVFARRALRDIVAAQETDFVCEHAQQLSALLAAGRDGEAAQLLGVERIEISDIDVTVINDCIDPTAVYSTWNVGAFCIEYLELPFVSLGTHLDVDAMAGELKMYDDNDGFAVMGSMVERETQAPFGSFRGMVISHEEVISMGDFFSVRDKAGKLLYKPSVFFVYKPSDAAAGSVHLMVARGERKPNKTILITRDRMAFGGEAVGIVLRGREFPDRYVGNYLDLADTVVDNPTIMQVAAPSYAAFKYMKAHPREGLLFPENLDPNEMMEYALPYFKRYDSFSF